MCANNLDDGIATFFEDSPNELTYGKLASRPFLYLDDITKIVVSRDAAQIGLTKLINTTDLKLLYINTTNQAIF